jgi:hypothetical protein
VATIINPTSSSFFCITINTLKLLMQGTNLKSIIPLPTSRMQAKT